MASDRPVSGAVGPLVDHLFRSEAGRLTARLARLLGPGSLDLAEELVQAALMKALAAWPYGGVPDNPTGWLWTAARNGAVDAIRRHRFVAAVPLEELENGAAGVLPDDSAGFAREIADDQLRLIFACCHPLLSLEAQVALTLKTIGGFGVAEIARAFLEPAPTVAQRLVRAKAKLAAARVPFAVPGPEELPERLSPALDVVYLLFNEGYGASRGETLVRADMAREAIRLAELLASAPATASPETAALAALLCLQGARLAGRSDGTGNLLVLAEQDRATWDAGLIARGFGWLRRSLSGEHETRWHIEAAIAATHAAAPGFAATDWGRILELYDRLMMVAPSPVVALNRAVALAEVAGPAAALQALAGLEAESGMARYPLLAACRAEFYRRLGDGGEGRHLRAALALDLSEPERRLLERRLAASSSAED